MKIRHARVVLWMVLLGGSMACAQRYGAEAGSPAPAEASQETPPGVPAVVRPAEPGDPGATDQDLPPGVEPARGVPQEADREPPADPPAAAEPEPAAAQEAATPRPPDATQPAREENPEVRELKVLGPTYTPHDRAPTVIWDTEAQALVSRKLLPVLQSQRLPARTRALFWILLRPDGSIADVVPQTLTENSRFDAVAAEVVRQLRFTPAIRNGREVPVWVIQEISLLMQ